MSQAGFARAQPATAAHVIATMWSVSDAEAARVAEDEYTALVHD